MHFCVIYNHHLPYMEKKMSISREMAFWTICWIFIGRDSLFTYFWLSTLRFSSKIKFLSEMLTVFLVFILWIFLWLYRSTFSSENMDSERSKVLGSYLREQCHWPRALGSHRVTREHSQDGWSLGALMSPSVNYLSWISNSSSFL